MIAFARGTVVEARGDRVVLDIGALGLVLACPPATVLALRPGTHAELHTSVVVREDGWTIYGFDDADTRAVFEQVQTVSGIGPRIALALLSTLTPDDLRRAVAAGDEAALTRVSGIGRKGAQRILLELTDRLGPAQGSSMSVATSVESDWQSAVVAGLVSLGWSVREAEQAVSALDPTIVAQARGSSGADPDVSALLKAALRSLDRS